MILYFTDNPLIQKEIPGSILLYQLYNWRVMYDKENSDIDIDIFKTKKTIKKKTVEKQLKNHKEIVGVVAESNYKLQYELIQLKKPLNLYLWHNYKNRKLFLYGETQIQNCFFKYLQRSLFSRILYDKISAFNMQRIEQFLIYIAIHKYKISKHEDIEYLYETDRLINTISHERSEFWYIVDKLMYHSRRLDITDAFTGKFEILNKQSSIQKIYEKHKDKKKTKLTNVFLYILRELEGIVPYVDILKTIRYMENNELIELSSAGVFLKIEEQFYDNVFELLNKERWELLYASKDYMFDMFPPMNFIEELTFKCPECGSTKLCSSPVSFWCSTQSCSFKINRVISPVGIQKNIGEKDLLRMLKFGDTIIKNSYGGYNRFFLNKNKKGFYFISPKIYNNDINPDKD